MIYAYKLSLRPYVYAFQGREKKKNACMYYNTAKTRKYKTPA